MRIRIHLGGLRRTKPHEHIIRFLFGGAITLAAGIVAKRYGPEVGGLFLAFPAIFPATITLIAAHEKRKKQSCGMNGAERGKKAAAVDARGTAMGTIALLLFGLESWLLLGDWPPAAALSAAAFVWFACALLLWDTRRRLWRLRRNLHHSRSVRRS